MTDIANLGIKVDSSPAKVAKADLDALAKSALGADQAVEKISNTSTGRMTPAMNQAGEAARRSSFNSRLLTAQLSQLGQQGMVTGNYLYALAVQLPDIGLAFGALGTVIGSVAGVALPMLVAAITNTDSSAKDTAKSLDDLSERVNAYVTASQAATMSTQDLIDKYGSLSVQARAALEAIADVRLTEAILATNNSIQMVLGSLTEMRDYTTPEDDGFGGLKIETFRVLKDRLDLTSEAIGKIQNALVDLASAGGLEEQADAAREVQEALLDAYGTTKAMPAPLMEAYLAMGRIVVQAGEVTGEMERADNGMQAFVGATSAAIDVAQMLAGAVFAVADGAWDAVGAFRQFDAQQLFDQGNAVYGQVGARGDPRVLVNPNANPITKSMGRAKRGSGGESEDDKFEKELEKLKDDLAQRDEVVNEWYAKSQETLADSRAKELLGEQGHKDAMLALEREYSERMQEIEVETQQSRLSQQANFWGMLGSVIAAGGGQATKAYAAVMGAQAVISAYAGAAKALADPNITWWGRIAAYGSVLAAGMGAVAGIKQAGNGVTTAASASLSRSSVGSTARTPAAQAVTPEEPIKEVNITVKGIDRDALFTGAMFEKIFDGIMDEADLRGVNLRFIS